MVIPQDFAATFVDFAADFADLEVRREGDNSDNVELDQVLLMSNYYLSYSVLIKWFREVNFLKWSTYCLLSLIKTMS